MRATTTGWLTDINAAGRKLNNDIREVPSGLSGRLREANR
jgi:hypothetical protein